jgi:hypothetical protein
MHIIVKRVVTYLKALGLIIALDSFAGDYLSVALECVTLW